MRKRLYRFLESGWSEASASTVEFNGKIKYGCYDYVDINRYDLVEVGERDDDGDGLGIETMKVFRKFTGDVGGGYRYFNIYDLLGSKAVEDVTVQVNREDKLNELGI